MSGSILPYADAKYILFTDFDGTITTADSNDYMTDTMGFGRPKRRELNYAILDGKIQFKDAFREMLESVGEKHTFDEVKEAVNKHVKLDPGFKDFYEWSKKANLPVVIVSSGMSPIIRAIFAALIGPEEAEKIQVVSNEVDVRPDGKFSIVYKHPDSHYGHDKSLALKPYRDLPHKPVLFFCGDGVSDMSAAGESDILFVKVGKEDSNDLADYCDKKNIKYTPFKTFTEVRDVVQDVVEGKKKVEELRM